MADMKDRYEFILRVARLTQDPEDKLEVMISAAKLGKGLNAENRSALASAYHKRIDAKMEKWLIVSKIQYEGNSQFVALAKDYLKRVGDEISDMCNEILETVNNYLLPSSKTGEAAVFYYKMKGDYSFYLAQVNLDADRKREAASQSLEAYEAATAIANRDLPPANLIRLRLAFHFMVFLCEIMNNPGRAVDIASQAIKDAASEMHILDRKAFKKCYRIIRKMEENIAFWTADTEEDEHLPPPPAPECFNEAYFDSKCRV